MYRSKLAIIVVFMLALAASGCKQEPDQSSGSISEYTKKSRKTHRTCPGSFIEAVKNGNVELVMSHIEKGCDVNAASVNGGTPLQLAVFNAHKDVAELLIVKGADVNSKSNNGVTPLHTAADKDLRELVELLISKGADVNAKNNRGDTPLHYAAELGFEEVAELLRKHGGKD